MMRVKNVLLGAAFILSSSTTLATNWDGNRYQWEFLSGQPWPQGYNQNIGKPDNLTWAYNEYPQDFFARINNALPERQLNEAFISDDSSSTIHLSEDAEVFVTFIHEGAGYRNSFGYFTFDRENPPTSREEVQETIVFPNLSYPHMTNGHRLSLGVHPAGTSIGFFIAANGFSYYNGVKSYEVPYYYTLKDLNPEHTDELRQHAVLLYDDEVSEVIIGFEDLPRTWGDNDFNDAIFSVKSTPETAIDQSSLIKVPDANDSDADGIPDDNDEFPNDYRRSHSSYYPSQSGLITLAFEDNWPSLGDFDFNDLVIKKKIQITYDSSGLISGFIIQGKIAARGGAKSNGFAVRLIDIVADEVDSAVLTIGEDEYDKYVDGGQQDAVLRLWSNSKTYTNTGQSGSCSHFNTNKACDYFEPVEFTFDVKFANGLLSMQPSQFDFFIFRTNDYSHEIHLPDYAPTDWFNQNRFQRGQDTSDPENGRYFRTETNLPWAIQIFDDWNYPREYIDVLWAYPDYETWVESNGSNAIDWYNTSERTTHFYTIE